MPYKRAYRRRAPARRPRRNNQLATRPKFIPRGLAYKRYNNLSTKVFYFKESGEITTGTTGTFFVNWNVQNIVTAAPAQVADVFKLYDEFKVLAMSVKLFPANVGIESDTAILGSNGLLRGDQIVWSDQKGNVTVTAPANIQAIINQGSARLINPRNPYARTLYRAKGNTEWGKCENPAVVPDSWDGSVSIYGQETTNVALRKLWYWSRTYKIIVRGRTA